MLSFLPAVCGFKVLWDQEFSGAPILPQVYYHSGALVHLASMLCFPRGWGHAVALVAQIVCQGVHIMDFDAVSNMNWETGSGGHS